MITRTNKERERGFYAMELVTGFTRNSVLASVATEGYVRKSNPRLIVNLTHDGINVAQAGVEAGFSLHGRMMEPRNAPLNRTGANELERKPSLHSSCRTAFMALAAEYTSSLGKFLAGLYSSNTQ